MKAFRTGQKLSRQGKKCQRSTWIQESLGYDHRAPKAKLSEKYFYTLLVCSTGGVYNTRNFFDRVVLLRSNPHFRPIFRPRGVIRHFFRNSKMCYCGQNAGFI